MGEAVYPSFQFNDNMFVDDYNPLSGDARDDDAISRTRSNQDPWFESDEHRFMDLFSSVLGQEEKGNEFSEDEQQRTLTDSDDWMKDDLYIPQEIIESKNLEAAEEDVKLSKPKQEKPVSFPLASWELLNSYGKGFKMPREEINLNDDETRRKLSTEEILRMAGERFIQFSTSRIDGISMFIHPYGSPSGLSMNEANDVELIHLLLSAAENVGSQRFNLASRLISRCLWMSSVTGNPIQRVAFYFAEALQEKVNRESGMMIITDDQKKRKQLLPERRGKTGLALGTNNTFLASHQELPFVQVTEFAGIQAIIDSVKTAKKIHLIDLQIRSGIQWTGLMQGLADHPPMQGPLKITAVGTADQKCIEETGKRLTGFAQSLNLPFSFKAVYVKDMKDFREELLEIEGDETVAVYSNIMLRSMISRPDCLENLMREIAKLKPEVMVVVEVEANHNSPSFVDRFIETLFFYSAFFDCLEDCMERDSQARMVLEGTYFGEGITNIIATEGEDRVTRNVKIDVWRAFLARFGMREIELSESSKYQASLVLKQFAQGGSCTLDSDGKSLIVGWKGTPLHSLSIWNFS